MASTEFTKLVPGFDFLQGLMQNAGAGLPSMSQWIAPTLDPAELDKRISELRTVQFWLEQNAKMLGATIQALEVQRMTLATLRTMNMPLAEMGKALKIDPPAPEQDAPAPAAAEPRGRARSKPATAAKGDGPKPAGVVDPMQWWGALTRQFTELASQALKDTPPAPPAPAPGGGAKDAAPARKAAPRRGTASTK